MIIMLTGVACVGKSSIGKKLAEDIGFGFFDLDVEIESFYGKSISSLKAEIITEYSWRLKGAPVLKKILEDNRSRDIVVALPPSGLMDAYLRVIKKSNALVVVLNDTPENILKRITVYDVDSKTFTKALNGKEKKYVLSEIKKDVTYYERSYSRAHFQLDITGLDEEQAASALKELLGLETPVEKAERPKLKKVSKRVTQTTVTYTNRRGQEYYLHVGKTKKGNLRYHFSTKDQGELAPKIPGGYEIYENPNAQVLLRKIQPKLISEDEVQILGRELKEHARPNDYRLDVRGEIITIFQSDQRTQGFDDFPGIFSITRMKDWCDRHATYMPIFRFILADSEQRLFIAERYCFRGSIDDWIQLMGGDPDSLKNLVKKYVKHFGEKSFFELM